MKKRNRLDVSPIIYVVAGLVLTMIIVGAAFNWFGIFRKQGNDVMSNMSSTMQNLAEADIMQFDGIKVSGAEVINIYSKYLDGYTGSDTAPFEIVINNGYATHYYDTIDFKAKLRDETDSSYYVKPTTIYVCTVTKNANGLITQITFTK